MKLIRDSICIFAFYIIGDLFTTAVFLHNGGIEGNPMFSMLLLGGTGGIIQILLVKVMVFFAVILMMYILLMLELEKMYFFFVHTIFMLSIFVIISNLMVYFINRNIFQLLGIF